MIVFVAEGEEAENIRKLIEKKGVKALLLKGRDSPFNVEVDKKKFPTFREAEMGYLKSLIEKVNGNIMSASKISGLPRQTLYKRIKKYGLEDCVVENRTN